MSITRRRHLVFQTQQRMMNKQARFTTRTTNESEAATTADEAVDSVERRLGQFSHTWGYANVVANAWTVVEVSRPLV